MSYYIILSFKNMFDHVIWIRTDVVTSKIKHLSLGQFFDPIFFYTVSVTPLCLSSVHALLTCYLFHQITAYVYYRPAFPPYRTSLGLSHYLDT